MVNWVPSTTIELKTPMKMWIRKSVNYTNFHIFGSPVYMLDNAKEITKLDLKSRKCTFLEHSNGVKGCRLWDLSAHKVVVNRDTIFLEDKLQSKEKR